MSDDKQKPEKSQESSPDIKKAQENQRELLKAYRRGGKVEYDKVFDRLFPPAKE